ncbi:MAG: VWA domain-containing protein [Thermoguttaceae bacterium]|nr:VWA domain-containing protein [Thermoguttaceae bacterium]MBQ9798422.1 VWA domain-containing protein [Thermoguttaceae bacterium]
MARRLPVYVLIDVSGSMQNEPIQAVQVGLEAMLQSLKHDPYALDSVWLSLISYGTTAEVLVPLTELEKFTLPRLEVKDKAALTMLGAGLKTLCEQYDAEIHKNTTRDWRPILIVITDGKPSDVRDYNQMVERICKNYNFARIVGCAAGPKARVEPLEKLTAEIHVLSTMDENDFKKFWCWISTILEGSCKAPSTPTTVQLPPPPSSSSPGLY